MRKKIAILGSTGSIGKNLIDIIKKDKKNFEVVLLSANKNYNELYKQSKLLNVKNLVISNFESFKLLKKKIKNDKIKIFNNYNKLHFLFKNKVDYTMSSISGLDGLEPTLYMIDKTKTIAIANKESIICGWNLIQKKLQKNKTKFIPIDSEHFSIYSLLQNHSIQEVEKIYITASGGPFINFPKNLFYKIKPRDALRHPNWKMGKKITIDSATLMNKVFEVIEAKNIFNLDYKNISILTHPKSYIHAIVKFKNELVKMLLHEPDMKIPIYSSIYNPKELKIKTKPLNLKIINDLSLNEVDHKKFPLINILNKMPKKTSLFETVLITINDYLVYEFLKNKISFPKLVKLINKISNLNEFQKFKKIKPKNVDDIYRLRDYVSSKMDSLAI